MNIGVPREIKIQESRVGLTPAGVDALTKAGSCVYIETGAGDGSGFTDKEYEQAGAKMLDSAAEVYDIADMIIKVKEPLACEYPMLKENQVLFTYLHLAPDHEQVMALLESKVTAIAYETVQMPDRSLPLLAPMSEVAGRMSIQIGARFLEKMNGGMGILLGGVPGVEPAHVVIIGGGNVGLNAAKMAIGFGARVTVLDVSISRLSYLDDLFYGGRVTTVVSNSHNIAAAVKNADLVIGAVLIPGAKTPKLVTEDMVKNMRPGAVLVDVAIDQGGSIETIDRMTSHEQPCFIKHGVVHYSVPNMPGAVPRTSTLALTNATLPYAIQIASKGAEQAMLDNPALAKGLNTYRGHLTYEAVAAAQGMEYTPFEALIQRKKQ